MIQLSIKMLPESASNQYAYNYADLLVQVKLERGAELKTDFSFVVYSERLWLMAEESTWNKSCWHYAWQSGSTITMKMHGHEVWLPGKYFFLMLSKNDGSVIRFDLELDEKCCFTVGKPRRYNGLSGEDILVTQDFDADAMKHLLCPDVAVEQDPLVELDEVLYGFFNHSDLIGYEFTPAAVDKACRLLIMNAQRGLIHLCSKHYYAVSVYEKMACRLNDFVIQADDIDEDEFTD